MDQKEFENLNETIQATIRRCLRFLRLHQHAPDSMNQVELDRLNDLYAATVFAAEQSPEDRRNVVAWQQAIHTAWPDLYSKLTDPSLLRRMAEQAELEAVREFARRMAKGGG